jgi:SAM-dependent methyltransferase
MKDLIKNLIPHQIALTIRDVKQSFESLFFSGKNYECPFCKGTYRKLLHGGENLPFFKDHKIIGGGRRPNMLCPRCHSTDRDRLIYYYLTSNNLLSKKNISLLHISPEPSIKKYLKTFSNINYVSGDKFEKGYNGHYYDKDTKSLDLTALSFPENSFDIIICNHVLEHIVDENKALDEIYRVLKPDGWAILQVPIASELEQTRENNADSDEKRILLYGQRDHVRLYGMDYLFRLTTHGFKVENWSPENNFNQNQLNRYAINALEKVFIASKLVNS